MNGIVSDALLMTYTYHFTLEPASCIGLGIEHIGLMRTICLGLILLLVMCTARLQAVGQAKPGLIRPSQARPKSQPDHSFGLA